MKLVHVYIKVCVSHNDEQIVTCVLHNTRNNVIEQLFFVKILLINVI